MKYHLIPGPAVLSSKQLKNNPLRLAYNNLKAEIEQSLVALRKKEPHTHDAHVYFLHEKTCMEALCLKLQAKDEVILHGEGQPFMIGLAIPSEFTISPYALARLLHGYGLPNCDIELNLLTCNSASQWEDFNFAKDTSQALSHAGHPNITVSGYTGYVKVKGRGKYSVTSDLKEDSKGTHASLQDAKCSYKEGKVLARGKTLCDFKSIEFSWATEYITKAIEDIAISTKASAQTCGSVANAPSPLSHAISPKTDFFANLFEIEPSFIKKDSHSPVHDDMKVASTVSI